MDLCLTTAATWKLEANILATARRSQSSAKSEKLDSDYQAHNQ